MIGETLSHYRIEEKLGEGGMGVVYRATDLKLDRSVALKVLSAQLASDTDARTRFLREAKAAAALDHSNICTVYEINEVDGQALLAMQLIEGPTVKEKIAERPLKLDEALDIAIQTAGGLQAAHEKGLVHRDVKSANLMLTAVGQVKITDFGLARLADHTEITTTAAILGTPAYMSPEQAQGRPVDRRSDIFSFGVVLYEMVTGRLPFQGANDQSVIYAIINQQPEPPTALRTGLPTQLDRIILKALAKEPAERYQHADDLMTDLRLLRRQSAARTPFLGQSRTLTGKFSAKPLTWVLVGSLALMAVALAVWFQRTGNDSATLEFSAPKPFTSEIGYEISPDFSPDGNQIVFAWDGPDQGSFDLYIGLVGSSSRLQLTHTPEDEYSPAWSPNGQSIAFARKTAPERLGIFIMPAIGGQARFLAEVASDEPGEGAKTGISLMYYPTLSWTPDGQWLLTADRDSRGDEFKPTLVSVESGEKRIVGKNILGRTAAISPDGKGLAFVGRDLFFVPLTESLEPGAKPTRLTRFTMALGRPTWTPDGADLLVTGVPDDESHSVVRLISLGGSAPRRILELGDQVAQQTVSRSGRLAFVRRMNDLNIWAAELSEPTHVDRVTRLIASTSADLNSEFASDGAKIAFASARSGDDEIWVCDHDGTNPVQVTDSGEEGVGSPTWSPDGKYLAFDGYAKPQAPLETSRNYHDWEVLIVRSDGGAVRRLTFGGGNVMPAWSPDGKWIYYTHIRSTPPQLYRVRVDGGEPELVAKDTGGSDLSPDGKWVYFGRSHQVWRKPVRGGQEELVVEQRAGAYAVTNEGIYFIPPKPADGRTAIAYHDFATGATTTVYQTSETIWGGMDVSSDGRRLLFNQLDQKGSDIMVVEDFWR